MIPPLSLSRINQATFASNDDEDALLGPSLMVANSFRITSAKPRFEPGPRYASNSVEVLEDWLQLDTDEFAELLATEAIVM